MSHAPVKPLYNRKWGARQRHYFVQRMDQKWRRKVLDKRAVA